MPRPRVLVLVPALSAALLVASALGSLILYAGLLRVTGLDEAIYYRPHER